MAGLLALALGASCGGQSDLTKIVPAQETPIGPIIRPPDTTPVEPATEPPSETEPTL